MRRPALQGAGCCGTPAPGRRPTPTPADAHVGASERSRVMRLRPGPCTCARARAAGCVCVWVCAPPAAAGVPAWEHTCRVTGVPQTRPDTRGAQHVPSRPALRPFRPCRPGCSVCRTPPAAPRPATTNDSLDTHTAAPGVALRTVTTGARCACRSTSHAVKQRHYALCCHLQEGGPALPPRRACDHRERTTYLHVGVSGPSHVNAALCAAPRCLAAGRCAGHRLVRQRLHRAAQGDGVQEDLPASPQVVVG